MASVAIAAPINEKTSDRPRLPCGNKIIATASPNPAPALMPRIEGLAIGLFVTPCMIAPATAKLAPQVSAARRRGKRSVCTIISCTFAALYDVKDCMIVAMLMSCAPIQRESRLAPASARQRTRESAACGRTERGSAAAAVFPSIVPPLRKNGSRRQSASRSITRNILEVCGHGEHKGTSRSKEHGIAVKCTPVILVEEIIHICTDSHGRITGIETIACPEIPTHPR